MSLSEERTIRWFTTPNELREIADKMEREFPYRKLGDSTQISVFVSGGLVLSVNANQTRMLDEEKITNETTCHP